jgi:hypothetical protein
VPSLSARRGRWPRWIARLIISVLIAAAAQYWPAPAGPRWVALVWLLPAAVGFGMLSSALWELLGSRREVGPSRAAQQRAGRRRLPRNPKVHLHELRRSRDHWAIMLRLPPEGACDVAHGMRRHVFDLYRAPSLPLPGCSNGRCLCGYSGLKERRRRNVLPPGLERDRRAGAVIAWPAAEPAVAPVPHERNPVAVVSPLVEALR